MPRRGRDPEELRPLSFKRRYTRQAPGSVLVRMGRTTVLCTCCVEQLVPPFLVGSGKGWLSAEYGMLPGSTSTRKPLRSLPVTFSDTVLPFSSSGLAIILELGVPPAKGPEREPERRRRRTGPIRVPVRTRGCEIGRDGAA